MTSLEDMSPIMFPCHVLHTEELGSDFPCQVFTNWATKVHQNLAPSYLLSTTLVPFSRAKKIYIHVLRKVKQTFAHGFQVQILWLH